MLLAILLLLFILVVGPTVFIAQTFTDALGAYLYNFIPMSLDSGAFGGGEWLNSWTIFYWAWWISWAPFVGTFLARISRGRTIREYLIGVLLVPSGVSFVWFAILGGTALDLQLSGQADLIKAAAKPEVALFTTLEQFPISSVTSFLVIILVSLFFVSGADAASVVMGTMSSRGALEPTRPVVVVWGSLTGLTAAVLLHRRRPDRAATGGDHRGRSVRADRARHVRRPDQGAARGVAGRRRPAGAGCAAPVLARRRARRGAGGFLAIGGNHDARTKGTPVPGAVRPLRRDAADARVRQPPG